MRAPRVWGRRLRLASMSAGVFLSSLSCADSPETTARVDQALAGVILQWSSATSQNMVALAPRNDGSALVSTREDVLAFSTSGAVSVVFDGSLANRRPIIREGTEGFAVPSDGKAHLFDSFGQQQSTVPLATHQYLRLIPGSLQTFVPAVVSLGSENGRVTDGQIFSDKGESVAQFPASDLVKSRTTASYVVWATRTTLNKSNALTGKLAWSKALAVQKFETDENARFSIVNRAGDTRIVQLLDEAKQIGLSTFSSPLWNLAIAPTGKYAVANNKTIARLFKLGAQVATILIGSTNFPVSADVSDLGYVLIGLQNRALNNASVALYDKTGALQWSKTLANDTHGFRPEVRFTPNGNGFFIREKSTLSFYSLVMP